MRCLGALAVAIAAIATLSVALVPGQLAILRHIDDNFQHIAAFAGLTLISRLAFPRCKAIILFACLAAFGGLIEIAQSVSMFQRQADLKDWAIDCITALIVLALAALAPQATKPQP